MKIIRWQIGQKWWVIYDRNFESEPDIKIAHIETEQKIVRNFVVQLHSFMQVIVVKFYRLYKNVFLKIRKKNNTKNFF